MRCPAGCQTIAPVKRRNAHMSDPSAAHELRTIPTTHERKMLSQLGEVRKNSSYTQDHHFPLFQVTQSAEVSSCVSSWRLRRAAYCIYTSHSLSSAECPFFGTRLHYNYCGRQTLINFHFQRSISYFQLPTSQSKISSRIDFRPPTFRSVSQTLPNPV
jgi:hypothetical protein